MKCQSCDSTATVHLTDIVNGHKREIHLCQPCAEKREIVKHQELNLSAILQTVIGQHIGPLTDELARLTCPSCGIKYMEFKAEGRLGCPQDYEVFRDGAGASPAADSSGDCGMSAKFRCMPWTMPPCKPNSWSSDNNSDARSRRKLTRKPPACAI